MTDVGEGSFSNKTPLLPTADQYAVWKARIYTACWAAAQVDIFSVKDVDCQAFLKKWNETDDEKGRPALEPNHSLFPR